jgi:heme/copper-type cytochrome/quinol oxidase subunit 1
MKKTIYIILFTFLGVLLQFLVHAAIEIPYLGLLNHNFEKYGFGLTWSQLLTIHAVLTIILILIGALFGFFAGKFCWRKIYIEHAWPRRK